MSVQKKSLISQRSEVKKALIATPAHESNPAVRPAALPAVRTGVRAGVRTSIRAGVRTSVRAGVRTSIRAGVRGPS